jgi:hypothetical protein
MNEDFLSYLRGAGQNFQNYAAGTRRYGGGRDVPNIGPSDKTGYKERDAAARRRRNAMLKRMQAGQAQRFMSSDYLTPDMGSM